MNFKEGEISVKNLKDVFDVIKCYNFIDESYPFNITKNEITIMQHIFETFKFIQRG